MDSSSISSSSTALLSSWWFFTFSLAHLDWGATWKYLPLLVHLFLFPPPPPSPTSPWMCLFLLLCTVGSFSEHLDQINGRSECVDSTDNTSKPSSEPTSHMARQRLENTEKKRIAGKVTKSLSASALSLMIPGGRETSTRMKLCDLCMYSPPSSPNLECKLKCKIAWGNHGWDCRTTLKNFGLTHPWISLPGPRGTQKACTYLSQVTFYIWGWDERSFLPIKVDFICFLKTFFSTPQAK